MNRVPTDAWVANPSARTVRRTARAGTCACLQQVRRTKGAGLQLTSSLPNALQGTKQKVDIHGNAITNVCQIRRVCKYEDDYVFQRRCLMSEVMCVVVARTKPWILAKNVLQSIGGTVRQRSSNNQTIFGRIACSCTIVALSITLSIAF